jgi:hypothetical protein
LPVDFSPKTIPRVALRMPARHFAYQAAGSVSKRIGEKEKQY